MGIKEKGLRTKQMIVEKSLGLFSVKGYFHTSINDILQETQLTKGGLYAHFKSKEAIWYATYDKAIAIWKDVIFNNIRGIDCPLERLNHLIDRHLNEYIGKNTFEGGGFFLNMLIEFSVRMLPCTQHILRGFHRYAALIESWIVEAKDKQLIDASVNSKEAGHFIVCAFYGTTALYATAKDQTILQQTTNQLQHFVHSLRQQ